jgi:hypothetical protein
MLALTGSAGYLLTVMFLARLGLCAYLLALALAAALPVDVASPLSADGATIGSAISTGDASDELIADADDRDGSEDDLGVDGDDDAVSVARVTLPQPARLAQPVAAFIDPPRSSAAIDDLFRPPRLLSVRV